MFEEGGILEKQNKTKVVTVRVTPETKDRLDELARITNRSKAYLLEQAIASYLDRNNWQVEAISQAVKEADRPDAKWVSQKDVEDRFL